MIGVRDNGASMLSEGSRRRGCAFFTSVIRKEEGAASNFHGMSGVVQSGPNEWHGAARYRVLNPPTLPCTSWCTSGGSGKP